MLKKEITAIKKNNSTLYSYLRIPHSLKTYAYIHPPPQTHKQYIIMEIYAHTVLTYAKGIPSKISAVAVLFPG